jgi:hypothetical protein
VWSSGGRSGEPRGSPYHGDNHHDGLTGILAWNVYTDHVAAFGFSEQTGLGNQLDAMSIFSDTPNAGPPPGHLPSTQLASCC